MGSKGEQMACDYLRQKGFRILEKNWRFRHSEVDIIAVKNNRLHFLEVKTRTSDKYGKPEESISAQKMHALKVAAEEYQLRNPQWKYLQFDVLAISIFNDQTIEFFYIEDVYF